MVTEKAKEITQDLLDSAQKIWLAGLGALALASEEGGKLFKELVAKGEEVQTAGKKQVEKAKDTVEGVKTVAESYWRNLEQRIDATVTAVLQRVGVPTKEEIEALTKKVEELTKSIEKLRETEKAQSKGSRSSTKTGQSK